VKIKRPQPPALPEMKKGTVLVLKVPPYYSKEYLYEVTSAGDKLIRASLYHSPTVKKQWTHAELQALFNNKIVRLAQDKDIQEMKPTGAPSQPPESP
jgi:hypothetical protein